MSKKSFGAGMTKTGNLNSSGGEKLKEIQAKTQYNFQYIPKEKIISNPKNEMYSQDGIDSLMESILINGLRHNLSVLYDEDNNMYRLVSGERRFHAICSMSPKDYETLFPAGIPCKVEKSNINDIDEEIMLISANHDVRESSMEVKRWEVNRLKELYEAKKLKGEIKNINAEIAKQLNISERQARKYTTAEKLIPELSELLNANGIDLNQADKFGKLDEDAQKSILAILKQNNGNIENSEFQSIKKLSEERAEEAKKYKEMLDNASKQIEEQESTVKYLEQKISQLEKTPISSKSREELEEEIKYITDAKNKAEKEKQKLETNIEKIKQQQKEKEARHTSISDTELKRISSIAKTEQALTLFENNFDVLKNNKTVIKSDNDLKIRVEILKRRIEDLLENL
jgi:ParB family chromosome partitioning protein